jgi:hypothetical protein
MAALIAAGELAGGRPSEALERSVVVTVRFMGPPLPLQRIRTVSS